MICRKDITLIVCVIIVKEIADYAGCLLTADGIFLTINFKCLASKVFYRCYSWTFTQSLTSILLQVCYKVTITLIGYDCQFVYVMYSLA